MNTKFEYVKIRDQDFDVDDYIFQNLDLNRENNHEAVFSNKKGKEVALEIDCVSSDYDEITRIKDKVFDKFRNSEIKVPTLDLFIPASVSRMGEDKIPFTFMTVEERRSKKKTDHIDICNLIFKDDLFVYYKYIDILCCGKSEDHFSLNYRTDEIIRLFTEQGCGISRVTSHTFGKSAYMTNCVKLPITRDFFLHFDGDLSRLLEYVAYIMSLIYGDIKENIFNVDINSLNISFVIFEGYGCHVPYTLEQIYEYNFQIPEYLIDIEVEPDVYMFMTVAPSLTKAYKVVSRLHEQVMRDKEIVSMYFSVDYESKLKIIEDYQIISKEVKKDILPKLVEEITFCYVDRELKCVVHSPRVYILDSIDMSSYSKRRCCESILTSGFLSLSELKFLCQVMKCYTFKDFYKEIEMRFAKQDSDLYFKVRAMGYVDDYSDSYQKYNNPFLISKGNKAYWGIEWLSGILYDECYMHYLLSINKEFYYKVFFNVDNRIRSDTLFYVSQKAVVNYKKMSSYVSDKLYPNYLKVRNSVKTYDTTEYLGEMGSRQYDSLMNRISRKLMSEYSSPLNEIVDDNILESLRDGGYDLSSSQDYENDIVRDFDNQVYDYG